MSQMQLTFLNGPLKDHSFAMPEKVSIGRGEWNTICIEDAGVSADHCLIFSERGRVFVRDEKSTNGTVVNSRNVTRAELYDEDVLLVGTTLMAIHRLPDGVEAIELDDAIRKSGGRGASDQMRQTVKISLSEMAGSKKTSKIKRSPGPTDKWKRRFS